MSPDKYFCQAFLYFYSFSHNKVKMETMGHFFLTVSFHEKVKRRKEERHKNQPNGSFNQH